MSALNNFKKSIISLDEIEKIYKCESYDELYKLINKLVEKEKLAPVMSSRGNGKTPKLFKRYRILKAEEDNSAYLKELSYDLSPKLSIDYYKNHMDKYKLHRKYILMLNDFIRNHNNLLDTRISMNERSFQIWGREKFISKEEGKTILKNLGLSLDFLNYYETSEPLSYYSVSKKIPQDILILENKDTYYTFRKQLIDKGSTVFNEDITTVIYGAGKGIVKAFNDFDISVEAHVSDRRNTIYYFGDLDYEGIIIYESLFKKARSQYKIKPFKSGYIKMIDKYLKDSISLPVTKDNQNSNIDSIFLNEFDDFYKNEIINILKSGKYIPQEIINISDL